MILFAAVMGLPTQMDVIWKLQNALKIRICRWHQKENVQAKVSTMEPVRTGQHKITQNR
jgi:hypothetical protein